VCDLDSLLRMPWTIGVDQEDGEIVLTIEEIPEFFAAGHTPGEAEANFWEALASHLKSYIELGQEPPRPDTTPIVDPFSTISVAGPEPGRRSADYQTTKPPSVRVAA